MWFSWKNRDSDLCTDFASAGVQQDEAKLLNHISPEGALEDFTFEGQPCCLTDNRVWSNLFYIHTAPSAAAFDWPL